MFIAYNIEPKVYNKMAFILPYTIVSKRRYMPYRECGNINISDARGLGTCNIYLNLKVPNYNDITLKHPYTKK